MNAGTKIVRSCELVEIIWMQVEDLGNSLAAITESALENGEFKNLRSAGRSSSSYELSSSGHSSTAYALSFPVMEKKRRKAKPSAHINYQISVFGGGLPTLDDAGGDSIGPVLHVSFWHLPTDFYDEGVYVEFPPQWDDWEIKDDRLLFWESEEEGKFSEWTFSVRLIDLGSEDALRESVIAPIKALIAGAQARAALPDQLPGLVFYADQEEDAGWNLVARTNMARTDAERPSTAT